MTSQEIKAGLLDAFFKIADRFGVPCVILAFVLYFGREAMVALHTTVLQPVVKSHVEFLDTTSETLREIGQVQQQQAVTLQELSNGQRDLKVVVNELIDGSRN